MNGGQVFTFLWLCVARVDVWNNICILPFFFLNDSLSLLYPSSASIFTNHSFAFNLLICYEFTLEWDCLQWILKKEITMNIYHPFFGFTHFLPRSLVLPTFYPVQASLPPTPPSIELDFSCCTHTRIAHNSCGSSSIRKRRLKWFKRIECYPFNTCPLWLGCCCCGVFFVWILFFIVSLNMGVTNHGSDHNRRLFFSRFDWVFRK